ncbi:MAG: adenylosuccinate lyase [Planctomycetota bacterium]
MSIAWPKCTLPPTPPYGSYDSPLIGRWGSPEMAWLFSAACKFSTWRKLWTALAKAEHELGLDISAAQVEALRKNVFNIDFKAAEEQERKVRHDVMAHVHAYGLAAPNAAGIIHLGATSCYVTDNGDLLQMRDALALLCDRLANVLAALAEFAHTYAALPTLGYTHYQPAQPVTVGRRACLWMQDFLLDLETLERLRRELPFLGVRGATGTQATFLTLFQGDAKKVRALEKRVGELLGIDRFLAVSGQTYTRKLDHTILAALSGIAQSAAKMGNDIRLLQHDKELEEPFEKHQIGSSAMAYKRNPMRAERLCGLARHLIALEAAAANTAATQWLERTLDDSANRRLTLAEGFLTADCILNTAINVSRGLVVNEAVIRRRLAAELPFMATEEILMAAVAKGGDRQKLHEVIRVHSMEAGRRVKQEGAANDLLARLKSAPEFAAIHADLDRLTDPALFVGLSVEQTRDFLKRQIGPVLNRYRGALGSGGDVRV